MSDIGHNSQQDIILAADRLKSFIERVENLESEKKTISNDIKEVYSEAKGTGFDPAIMRLIVKLRKMDSDAIQERDLLLETYKRALGMTL